MPRRKPKLDPVAGCATLLVFVAPIVLLAGLSSLAQESKNPAGAIFTLFLSFGLFAFILYAIYRAKSSPAGGSKLLTQQKKDLLRNKAITLTYMRSLSGHEFELFLADYFRSQGYVVDMTPRTTDQGADLLLRKDQRRIAVQAKQWKGNVGNKAVQAVHAGRTFYNANEAWVITTSSFTKAAQDAATRLSVRLVTGPELATWVSAAQREES